MSDIVADGLLRVRCDKSSRATFVILDLMKTMKDHGYTPIMPDDGRTIRHPQNPDGGVGDYFEIYFSKDPA